MKLAEELIEELTDKLGIDDVRIQLSNKWQEKVVKDAQFRVSQEDHVVTVAWVISVVGMTHETAVLHHLELVRYCNRILTEISVEYRKSARAVVTPVTIESARTSDVTLAGTNGNKLGGDPIDLIGTVELTFSE